MDKGSLGRHASARMTNDPRSRPNSGRVVEILAYPTVQLLDVAGPLQVFATANRLAAGPDGPLPYLLQVVAACGTVVTTSAGLGLVVSPLSHADAPLDTLMVAGGPGVDLAITDPELVDWVRVRAARAQRVASVCSGAFMLGTAGLLDGRRAATHWTRCAELAQRFPAAKVEADPIFVRDGPVWSSAGITAGIDLALALVEQDFGRPLALSVARHLVVFLKRPGGQAQFSATLCLQSTDERFQGLHEWIGAHLTCDLSLAALARKVSMSERSFTRRYAEATGTTPAKAVERLRVEAARHLLSDTHLPVKRVAERCGFSSEETFRRSFFRLLTATPQDYRSRFSV